jgi:hypothetical protein
MFAQEPRSRLVAKVAIRLITEFEAQQVTSAMLAGIRQAFCVLRVHRSE